MLLPSVPADMPLYDILNEFQKGGSHMAAVVKPKCHMRKPPAIVEKSDEDEANDHNLDLSTPLLSKKDDKLGSLVVDIERVPRPSPKKSLKQNEAVSSGLNMPNDSGDGEVVGIITLEDVFEELLQVKGYLLQCYLVESLILPFICRVELSCFSLDNVGGNCG